MFGNLALVLAAFVAGFAATADAQSLDNLAALKGLSPFSALPIDPGQIHATENALAANFVITSGLETGAIQQTTPLPFPEQRQQALRDAFITDANLTQLADGLGSALGAAYQARAHYIDADKTNATQISSAVKDLIDYAAGAALADAGAGKFFFSNETDGKTPVCPQATAIMSAVNGQKDLFGLAYGHPAGSPDADPAGNSRPFQTEPTIAVFSGSDYFNVPVSNMDYLRGPASDLRGSPSFSSGHTTYGYTGAVLLAILVPDRYQEMVTRGAEYGNGRILLGAHYAMDVIAGRTLALYDLAHLLAAADAYTHRPAKGAPPPPPCEPTRPGPTFDIRTVLGEARKDTSAALEAGCGSTVAACARQDLGRFNDPMRNEAFYASTQTYGLPVVHPNAVRPLEDVAALAPEAEYLLTSAFSGLGLPDANRILTETEGPGGGFLDDGSGFGVYSRLNLYAAAGRAAAMTKPAP